MMNDDIQVRLHTPNNSLPSFKLITLIKSPIDEEIWLIYTNKSQKCLYVYNVNAVSLFQTHSTLYSTANY